MFVDPYVRSGQWSGKKSICCISVLYYDENDDEELYLISQESNQNYVHAYYICSGCSDTDSGFRTEPDIRIC